MANERRGPKGEVGKKPSDARWRKKEEEEEEEEKKTQPKRIRSGRGKKKKEEKKEEEKGGEPNVDWGTQKKGEKDKKKKKKKKESADRGASSQKSKTDENEKISYWTTIPSYNARWQEAQNVPGDQPRIPQNWTQFPNQSFETVSSPTEINCLEEIEKAPTVYFLKHLRFHLSQICNRLNERDFRKQMIAIKNKAAVEKKTKKVAAKKPPVGDETKGKKVKKETKVTKGTKENSLKEQKKVKEKKKTKEPNNSLSVDNSYFLLGDVITNQNGRKSPENAFQCASDVTHDFGDGGHGGNDKIAVNVVGAKSEVPKATLDRVCSEISPGSFTGSFSDIEHQNHQEKWSLLQNASGSNDYIDFKPKETYENISPADSPSTSSRSSFLSSYIESETDSCYYRRQADEEESKLLWR